MEICFLDLAGWALGASPWLGFKGPKCVGSIVPLVGMTAISHQSNHRVMVLYWVDNLSTLLISAKKTTCSVVLFAESVGFNAQREKNDIIRKPNIVHDK